MMKKESAIGKKNREKTKFKELTLHEYIMAALLCFFGITSSLAIYQSDTTLAGTQTRMIIRVCVYVAFIVLIVVLTFIEGKIVIKKMWKLLIPVVCFFVTFLDDYTGESAIGLLAVLLLFVFFLVKDVVQAQTFKYFKNYLCIISLAGIVIYFSYIFHLSLPYRIVPYYEMGGADRYVDYTFGYLYIMKDMVRLCGLFNEPGYFGTIIALTLCAEQINLKKKTNIILFIAGCLTFSLAFIMIILGYIILLTYKKPKLFLFLVILFLSWFWIIPDIKTDIVGLGTIINRLTIVDGKLLGNNRQSDALLQLYETWKSSNHLIWGYGGGYVKSQLLGKSPIGSSLRLYLINYGVAGAALLYLPTMIYSIQISRKNVLNLFYIIVFCLSILQRPNIFSVLYYVILIGGIQDSNEINRQYC